MFSGWCPLHSLQPTSHLHPTSDRRLIFARHLATRMFPAIAIILRLLCLKGRTGRANTSLGTLYFHFAVTWSLPSTCHMQGGWYYLALPWLAHTISRIFNHEYKCSAARTSPGLVRYPICFDMISHIVTCVCSPQCHLYTFFISSPECAYLSPCTCKPFFIFLHLTSPLFLFVLLPLRYY